MFFAQNLTTTFARCAAAYGECSNEGLKFGYQGTINAKITEK